MREDPYEILGVPKNSSKSRIKNAYRKKAQENHPDKGGNKDEFVQIVAAYGILTDDRRRSKYDRTGRIDEPPPLRIQALQEVANLFTNLVSNEGVNIDNQDLVLLTRVNLKKNIENIRKNIQNIEKKKTKFERAMKKLVVKKTIDGEDPLVNALGAEIRMREDAIQELTQKIKLTDECINVLDNYEYVFATSYEIKDILLGYRAPTSTLTTSSF